MENSIFCAVQKLYYSHPNLKKHVFTTMIFNLKTLKVQKCNISMIKDRLMSGSGLEWVSEN